jgi:hypothetical protein
MAQQRGDHGNRGHDYGRGYDYGRVNYYNYWNPYWYGYYPYCMGTISTVWVLSLLTMAGTTSSK